MTAERFDADAFVAATGGLAAIRPGSDRYVAATSPANTSVHQEPGLVIRPRTTHEVAAAVRAAADVGASVVVQSTGHGAGRAIGAESLLIDTGDLSQVSVDSDARTATVGAGVCWGDVQAAAEAHGLLGLSGSSPNVGVAGYTFGGGVGWLTRAFGLASASLREVTYVDGTGSIRRAMDNAADPADRSAIWAFRGGAPPGIATEITFQLYQVDDLWAGYMLWPANQADGVIRAWISALDSLTAGVTSGIAMLSLPPEGPFPAELLGTAVVHLSYASADGEAGLGPMIEALRSQTTPIVDTTGPCDATRLATIHLDPPGPVPALGAGRWLSADAAKIAPAILRSGNVGADSGLQMVEMRHVATGDADVDGAMTTVPGPFLLHAVGEAATAGQRDTTERGLRHLAEAAAPVALRSAVSFLDGCPDADDAYDATTTDRLIALAETLDPRRVLSFERAPHNGAGCA